MLLNYGGDKMKIIKDKGKFGVCDCYHTDTDCKILCGCESVGWHMSISHPYRYPTWDEIKQVRYELMPKDLDIGMILPVEDDYINIHNFCFHLFELDMKGLKD
jgi:hypothetical protein